MILDTSVIIDIDRGVEEEKVEKLDDASPHKTCSVTVTEYFSGVFLGSGESGKAEKMLENVEEVPVKGEVAREAGRIIAELTEEGEMIGMNDVYIAAVARVHGDTLLTSDVEHFEKVEGVEVKDWDRF